VLEGQSPDEGEHVGVASVPTPAGTGSTAHAELPEEEGESFEQKRARPDWKCAKCGETVPGNFDLCWKCLSAEAGESEPDAAQLPSEDGLDDQEPEPDDSPVGAEVLEEPDQDVAMEIGCVRCGSTKLIRDVSVGDQGGSPDETPEIVVFRNPEALIFKDRLTGEIRADICGVCGHIEFRVANPGQLYRHYEKARGVDRPVSRTGFYSAPCVRCGMLVVSGSSCPHCGASQADS
jgi:hypothetical protein